MPIGIINANIVKRKHSHGNAANLVMTNGDECPLVGEHSHDVALVDALVHAVDGT